MSEREALVRQMIMDAVGEQAVKNGGFVRRDDLLKLDLADGSVMPAIDYSRGIRNPAELTASISVINNPDGPYADRPAAGGLFHYSYEGATGTGGSNTKLREAWRQGVPIIFFQRIAPGHYVPMFPVYVVDDDPIKREFLLALDESVRFISPDAPEDSPQRRYAEQVVRRRLHQAEFRGRVIKAYETRCTICRLRHGELLDAAHITGDREDDGLPVVSNGLSLCKIHHAAFDRQLLGIDADFVIHINRDLLLEVDGPMLKHGLQEMHLSRLTLPALRADQPDRDRLAVRFDRFLEAG